MNRSRLWQHGDTRLGLLITGFMLLVAFAGRSAVPHDPIKQEISAAFQGPSIQHPLGTDQFGRDVASRLVAGARYSLFIAVTAVASALVVGVLIGAFSGYRGGTVDTCVMAFVDFLMTFPVLVLAMLVTAVFNPNATVTLVALAVAFVPRFIRLMRASVLVVKGEDFIHAARGVGQNELRILLRHVVPNALRPTLTMAVLWMSAALLAEASLSFLGLGVQPPNPSWGGMVREGLDHITNRPHLIVFPALAVTITIFGFNLLGESLQDLYDPRLRGIARDGRDGGSRATN